MKLVILIPALNEEKKIGRLIENIPKIILGMKTTILVINDGSIDDTKVVAEASGAIVVSHIQNRGVGASFQTGLKKALELGADFLVNIDADGQYQPADIEKLLKPIILGEADFVTANRFKDVNGNRRIPEHMPLDKYYGNLLMSKLVSMLTGQNYDDVSSGFRAYSRKVMLALELTGKFTYTQESFIELVAKDMNIAAVSVSIKYFKNRKSRIAHNLWLYSIRTLKIIIKTFRDYKPFSFFMFLSYGPLLISLVSGVFLTSWFLKTGSFTPYKILGFVFIYTSAFTFALWVVGFLADMFTRIRQYQEKILYYEKIGIYKRKSS